MPIENDPGFKKPFWPTVVAACVFGGLLIIGFEIGRSAGEDKPVAMKARSTFLAKLEKDRQIAQPTSAPIVAEQPKETQKPAEEEKPKPKPTKPAPKPVPPPPTKPAEPKPEPKPEPKKPEPTPEPTAVMVKFDKVLPIFKAKCNICHGDPSVKGELDLRSLVSLAKSPNKKMVVPGNPAMSEMWLQIQGDDPQMPPPGKDKLTAAEKKLIFDWIKSVGK